MKQTFDVTFPDAVAGRSYEVPIPVRAGYDSGKTFWMFKSPFNYPCQSCGRRTYWFDKCHEIRACSPECRLEVIKKKLSYDGPRHIPLGWRRKEIEAANAKEANAEP